MLPNPFIHVMQEVVYSSFPLILNLEAHRWIVYNAARRQCRVDLEVLSRDLPEGSEENHDNFEFLCTQV